jgi:ketosteroid isomerase-like protein
VVLANPFGRAVRGWDQASQALEYASSRFRDGEVTASEEVARYASADLVVIHEKEQWQTKVSGGEELSRFGLRVTSTFRREDSTWKLVHRHAVRSLRQIPRARCAAQPCDAPADADLLTLSEADPIRRNG